MPRRSRVRRASTDSSTRWSDSTDGGALNDSVETHCRPHLVRVDLRSARDVRHHGAAAECGDGIRLLPGMTITVLTVLGTRPQYVKACTVSAALAEAGVPEILVDTGQHYDNLMADGFGQALGLRTPDYALGVGSGSHARQTARILEAVEQVIEKEAPALLIVFGDTNSSVAAALAASKMEVPIAHVEAGLRSFNRRMPEEVNRVVVDHLASLRFAPTGTAVQNLLREGITTGVHLTGDVMYDAVEHIRPKLELAWTELQRSHGLDARGFVLATIHRAENTDDSERWKGILDGVARVAAEVDPVLWVVHPRTRSLLDGVHLPNVRLVDPLPYVALQAAAMKARVILTDSGGLQKEAAFHATPCVTVRDETEWVELVDCGVNRLAGADPARITMLTRTAEWPAAGVPRGTFGDGRAAGSIAQTVRDFLDAAT